MPSRLGLLSRCTSWTKQHMVADCKLPLARTTARAPAVRTPPSPCSNSAVRAWVVEVAARIHGQAATVSVTSKGGERRTERRQMRVVQTAAAPSENRVSSNEDSSPSTSYSNQLYTLEDTRVLVETAMLAAVSGLAYLLSTILKLENGLGYFLPLPVVLAALRSGGGAGWRTMTATCFLLVVLLGPLRAMSYFFLHGLLAATLGSLWSARGGFWVGVMAGALVRMFGQLSYLVMSSVTMNENMFALLLSNVYNMLDQVSAALGLTGAPSPLAVNCTIFSLLLINGLTYCFLVHVVYRVVLGAMGYQLGPLPGIVSKYLRAGVVEQQGA
ncbi:hypothetical protein Vretimale_9635 [Volvox reticuliferus]|uniref:Uncharacterized protein n=1 Tax=Volvox reticuliferus TaxID=1737510 RepID=A0A8J4LQ83_9CHLO|nr:hypothetical protein Vretifemale_19214 [Volvox reticuliferus]GIM05194.1 hypothetical protein Vretimale_9635 [Volvox reticuliferus]